jgi:hypothetical protein
MIEDTLNLVVLDYIDLISLGCQIRQADQPFQGGLGLAVVVRFFGFFDKRCCSSNLLVATCLARALGSFAFGFFGPRGCLGYRLRSASLPHWSNWSASFAMLIF